MIIYSISIIGKGLEVPYLKRVLVIATAMLLWGCPVEENCQKVMQCEDDVEMICEKNDSGCQEDCHYYTHEYCYEVCKDDR